MKSIVLASSSSRRKELLETLGLKFTVDAAEIEEDIGRKLKPADLVKTISLEKATAAATRHPDSIVIAADTFGVLGDKLLGKPRSSAEAVAMLRMMSGRCHSVLTGFTILDSRAGRTVSKVVETRVYFKRLNDEDIQNYVWSGEPLDKAGAYAIQGSGSSLIERIDGDYYNVIGLPLYALVSELKKFGVILPGGVSQASLRNLPPGSPWKKPPAG
ncbi:MAG: Maf family protein [Dehalococcoidia bacterium]|jgi:septum formation protein